MSLDAARALGDLSEELVAERMLEEGVGSSDSSSLLPWKSCGGCVCVSCRLAVARCPDCSKLTGARNYEGACPMV